MNWKNIDLESPFEVEQDFLDGYNCSTLLLEVGCNVKVITKEAIRVQAMESLKNNFDSAVEVLDANLDNLYKAALKQRAIK